MCRQFPATCCREGTRAYLLARAGGSRAGILSSRKEDLFLAKNVLVRGIDVADVSSVVRGCRGSFSGNTRNSVHIL
ncbi:MAG: hypothetical protein WCP70_08435 [Methanothrix sp.]